MSPRLFTAALLWIMKSLSWEEIGIRVDGRPPNRGNFVIDLLRTFYEHGKDLKEELNRRIRAAWAAFAAVREATDQDLRARLRDSTVLSAFCYAAETWADTAATSRKLITPHRALEKCLLKFRRRAQHIAGLRGSDSEGMSRLREPAKNKVKHRWAGHIIRRVAGRWTKTTLEWIPRDAKCPRGRPPTRWNDVYAALMDQLRAQPDLKDVNVTHET
ncbi:hypothetical protein RB195_025413 [Necator americanus]